MIQSPSLAHSMSGLSFLHVAELIHRIRNEYARAISFASILAAKTPSHETKSALYDLIKHLQCIAQSHGVLSPPRTEGIADIGETLARLCQAFAQSTEIEHREVRLSYSLGEPTLIDAGRCWRVGLIVSELINNSFRHAFGSRNGNIAVSLAIRSSNVVCTVSDNGSARSYIKAGFGTQLTDAIAAELDGVIERQFSENGTTITLTFPKEGPGGYFRSV
jgi:two-component sensor histidine kinase